MDGSCKGVLAMLVVVAGLAGRSCERGGRSHGSHVEGEPGEALALAEVAAGLVPGPLPPHPFPLGGLRGALFLLH